MTFRFTIRDVLWLTVVVAMGVLWWGEYRQRMTDRTWNGVPLYQFQQVERERDTLKRDASPKMAETARRLAVDNVNLREQIRVFKKMVETYEAERAEMRELAKDKAL